MPLHQGIYDSPHSALALLVAFPFVGSITPPDSPPNIISGYVSSMKSTAGPRQRPIFALPWIEMSLALHVTFSWSSSSGQPLSLDFSQQGQPQRGSL